MEDVLEDLDDRGLVDAAVTTRDAEVAAGCRMLRVAAVWADRHPADGLFHQRTPLAMAGERTMRFGGEGTPDVAEFAPAKLGLEIGLNPGQAQALVADALDLRHRLPRLWSRVQQGNVPAWQARRIAFRTRTLSLEQAALVDQRLVHHVGNLSAGRLDNKIMAELIRVDPEGFARAAEKAATDRDVILHRPNEYGQQEVSIVLDAPDADDVYGMADHVGDVLFKDPSLLPEGVSDRGATTKGEWRAVAGWLMSEPALLLQVLTAADQPDLFSDLDAFPTSSQQQPDHDQGQSDHGQDQPDHDQEQSDHDQEQRRDPELVDGPVPDAGGPEPVESPTPGADDHEAAHQPASRSATPMIPSALSQADRERLLTELAKRIDPSKLTPRRVLHVHIGADALRDPEQHLARTEGLPPMVAATVRRWLDGSRVTVQPVIDPDTIQAVDSYETPPRMAEAIFTRSPGSVFPWSSSLSRRLDHDHTISYVPPPTGLPGQTGVHNLGPLNRREHRGKTFLIVRVRQPQPGIFVWRTDYGRVIITNPAGTHDLGTGGFADSIWQAVKHCDVLADAQPS